MVQSEIFHSSRVLGHLVEYRAGKFATPFWISCNSACSCGFFCRDFSLLLQWAMFSLQKKLLAILKRDYERDHETAYYECHIQHNIRQSCCRPQIVLLLVHLHEMKKLYPVLYWHSRTMVSLKSKMLFWRWLSTTVGTIPSFLAFLVRSLLKNKFEISSAMLIVCKSVAPLDLSLCDQLSHLVPEVLHSMCIRIISNNPSTTNWYFPGTNFVSGLFDWVSLMIMMIRRVPS